MIRQSLVLLALPVAILGAQDLGSRITAVGTGTVRLQFASHEGVCGNGNSSITVRRGDGRTTHQGSVIRSGQGVWEDECEAGHVPSTEASPYLVHLAATGESKPAKSALFPAMLADVPNPWRALLAIATDADRPRDVRNSAMFWVGQAAEDAATHGLEEVIESPGDKEIRKSAVFSLSQRPKDESVPALIRIARTHRDPELRRSAIFWLGQSRDDRAIKYFEEVLLGDGRR